MVGCYDIIIKELDPHSNMGSWRGKADFPEVNACMHLLNPLTKVVIVAMVMDVALSIMLPRLC